MLSILRKARLKDKEMRILMLYDNTNAKYSSVLDASKSPEADAPY